MFDFDFVELELMAELDELLAGTREASSQTESRDAVLVNAYTLTDDVTARH